MQPKKSYQPFLLALSLLVCVSLACRLGAASVKLPIQAAKAEVFASGLGQVYGLAFDEAGNLFATSTYQERGVVWKIAPDGAREIFAEPKDEGDVLSLSGMANHSLQLANLAVDEYGQVWVTSGLNGAGFVITPDGAATKFFVNTRISVMLDGRYPQGVAWDPHGHQLYLITSGPTGSFDYDHENFITTLNASAAAGAHAAEMIEVTDSGGRAVKAIPNTGISLAEENGNGLLVSPEGTLYFLGEKALYEVQADGSLEAVGETFSGQVLWGGAADNQGYFYVSSNTPAYDPQKDEAGEGTVWRLDSKGERIPYVEGLASPMGLAFYNGALYIADRADGRIVRVPAGEAGTSTQGKPAAQAPAASSNSKEDPLAANPAPARHPTATAAPAMKPADTATPKPTATPRPTATLQPTSTPETFDFTANWLHFGYDSLHSSYNPLEQSISLDNVAQLEPKWGLGCDQSSYSSIARSPAVYHSRLFVTGPANKLLALHARSGRDLWGFGQENSSWAPQPVVSESGVVLYLEGSGELYELYAIDAESGEQLWKAPVGFKIGYSETILPTVDEANGLVYVVENTFAPQEGKLYALDLATGEVVWYKSKATDNLSFTGDYALVDPAGKIIVAAELPGQYEGMYMEQVVRIDTTSRQVEVTYDLPPHDDYYSPYQAQDLVQCGDRLFVSYADNYNQGGKLLAAYDLAAPKILWQQEFPKISGALACNPDKNVLYVPTDPYLAAIDAATGTEMWKYMGLGAIYSPSIANGLVYFISDTNLYVLDEASGERVFRFPLGAQGKESSQVAIVDGIVYFSGNGGDCDLFALGLP